VLGMCTLTLQRTRSNFLLESTKIDYDLSIFVLTIKLQKYTRHHRKTNT